MEISYFIPIFIVLICIHEEQKRKRKFWTGNVDFKKFFESHIGEVCFIRCANTFGNFFENNDVKGHILGVTDKVVELKVAKGNSNNIVIVNIDYISDVRIA